MTGRTGVVGVREAGGRNGDSESALFEGEPSPF